MVFSLLFYYFVLALNSTLHPTLKPSVNSLISISNETGSNQNFAVHNNTCAGQSNSRNIVDISACETYLMCSNTRTFRMTCPLNWQTGERLYYNREKGFCDYKKDVKCVNGVRPPPPPTTQPPTTPLFTLPTYKISSTTAPMFSAQFTNTITTTEVTTTTHPPHVCNGISSWGNLPDPNSCAHYFACRNHKVVHRFKCQKSWSGEQLYYNPQLDYCDFQKNVNCNLAP